MEHQQAVQNLAVECYLLGEMTLAEREAFEEHYFECALCANDLRAAALFLEDSKHVWAAPAKSALPMPVAAPVKPSSSAWGWLDWLQPRIAAPALAALLLAVGFSLSRNVGLNAELQDALTPHVVSSHVLRPETRGEATLLTASEGDAVTLQFYLPEISNGELQFIVKSTDNSEVFRVRGQAPAADDPVTLSIPRFALAPGMYTLIVESQAAAGRTGSETARYPLEVRRP